MSSGEFFVRWRVRLGYPLALLVLFFAWPTPRSIVAGAVIGAVGLWVRGRAAGRLHKQEILTTTGPYAYTRNPLYLGSAILVAGAAIASRSWISASLLLAYFAVFYWAVMRREEQELRSRHGSAFDEYARAVPLFFPRMTAAPLAMSGPDSFSIAQYKRNGEYRSSIGYLILLAVLLAIWRLRLH